MDIQNLILLELTGGSYFKSDKLAEKLGVDHQIIDCKDVVEVILQLTDEGDEILNSGSHEYRVYCAIPESGIPQSDILIPEVKDDVQHLLLDVKESKRPLSDNEKSQLKKRKLVTESGEWQTAQFKAYNFYSLGAALPSGHLHPLLRVRSEFCRILCDMGYVALFLFYRDIFFS
ncbi:unnamed protein product [Schistosoma mattheei]|uniref:Uncharacterized protein n=1 Tax=Schistosoma mattheei TaxID=31246 RepID=A0A183PQV9_9TREM|nr:unnamed protein product [Schistosoma mattheei]